MEGNIATRPWVCACFRQYRLALVLLSFALVLLAGCKTTSFDPQNFISSPSLITTIGSALKEPTVPTKKPIGILEQGEGNQKNTRTVHVPSLPTDAPKGKTVPELYIEPTPRHEGQVPFVPASEITEEQLVKEKQLEEQETVSAPVVIQIESHSQIDSKPVVIEVKPQKPKSETSEVALNPDPASVKIEAIVPGVPSPEPEEVEVEVDIYAPKVVEEEFKSRSVVVDLVPSFEPELETLTPEVNLEYKTTIVEVEGIVLGEPNPDPEEVEVDIYAPKVVEEEFKSQSVTVRIEPSTVPEPEPETFTSEIPLDNATTSAKAIVVGPPEPEPEEFVVDAVITPPDPDPVEAEAPEVTVTVGPDDATNTDGDASAYDDGPDKLKGGPEENLDDLFGLGDLVLP